MSELDQPLARLCREHPRALGAVLCDFEGEAVAAAPGQAPLAPGAEALVREVLPRALELEMPVRDFMLRLGSAEPCALLGLFGDAGRRLGAGPIRALELCYAEVLLLVERLDNDFYVVLALRLPAPSGAARRALSRAAAELGALLP